MPCPVCPDQRGQTCVNRGQSFVISSGLYYVTRHGILNGGILTTRSQPLRTTQQK